MASAGQWPRDTRGERKRPRKRPVAKMVWPQRDAHDAHLTLCHEKLKDEMILAIPSLRAFAISLCANAERADDLVQETLMKAWDKLSTFAEGTNLSAWLFTILRNAFYSEFRKRRREVEDTDGQMAERLASIPAQDGHMDLQDFREALRTLPASQREVLVLVGGAGMSYGEVARICGCAVGTVKSRVNRARNRLARLLAVASAEEFGPDAVVQATLASVPLSALMRPQD
jgi:RNA polymerase sigma-70 factor (ECF subfamily)